MADFPEARISHAGNAISELPIEVLVNIFSCLDVPDKNRAAQVCQKWRDAVYVPSLWREVTVTMTGHWMCASAYPSLASRKIRRFRLRGLDLNQDKLLQLGQCIPDIERICLIACINTDDRNLSAAFSSNWPKLNWLQLFNVELKENDVLPLIAKNCPRLYEMFCVSSSKPPVRGQCQLERLDLINWSKNSSAGVRHVVAHGLSQLISEQPKETILEKMMHC